MNDFAALKQYLPTIGLIIATVASVFVTSASDNVLTGTEIGNLFLALLGAVARYLVPRLPGKVGYALKPVITFATAALQAALSYTSNGISMSEWAMVALTALAALGVVATNKYVPTTKAVKDNVVPGEVVAT
jgi:hypothetical protein